MRVLVTGGRGFIGSHVTREFEAHGANVAILDRVDGDDVTDPGAVARAVRGVDVVSHQAAKVGLGVDFGDAPAYVSDNDLGTAVLLRGLWLAGFTGRVVLASSMVVYGEGRYRCRAHGLVRPQPRAETDLAAGRYEAGCPECGRDLAWATVHEDARLDPRSVYAATKVAQEHLCACWARESGGSVVALRYHNVYGPGLPADTPYAGVAAIFRSAVAAGESPRVFEDGGQTRDFVHVGDVAVANRLALTAPVAGFVALNIASGKPRTVLDLANALVDVAGPEGPRPVVVGGYRTGDVRHVVAAADRAAEVLGFEAAIEFERGIADVALAGASDPSVG